MIIRYTLAASWGYIASSASSLQRRQGPLDLGADLVGARRRRRSGAAGSGCRSSRSAARSSRGTARAGGGSPRACRRRGRSSWLPSTSQTPSFSGGLNSTWKTWPFSSQVRRPPSRRTTSSSSTSISSTPVRPRPSSASFARERLGLRLGAREAVEDEAVGRLGGVDPLGDHADDHLVGDEVAAVHVLLRGAAELGLLAHRGAEDVAGRVVGQAQVFLQALALRSLAAARAGRGGRGSARASAATISGSPRSCASSAAPRAASPCPVPRRSRSGSRCRRRRSWPRSG